MTTPQLKELIKEVILEAIAAHHSTNEGEVDMTGKKCEKCKKGTYGERSQHDDMDGKVTCDKCGNRINRYKKTANEANTKESQKLKFAPVKEGRMKDIAMDLEDLSDEEFVKKYEQSKAEIRALLGGPLDESDSLCAMKLVENVRVSKPLAYHLAKNLSLTENVFRTYSDAYFDLINEVRELYLNNKIELCDPDAELVESDLGKKALFNGRTVYLDAPIEEDEDLVMELKHRGKNVHLNRPFRTPGGPKKYAVYVKSKGGNVKKVTFGDPNLRVRGSSAARRKSFAARHKCSQKKDRTTAGYWSCRSHRIKSLGNKGHGKYW